MPRVTERAVIAFLEAKFEAAKQEIIEDILGKLEEQK